MKVGRKPTGCSQKFKKGDTVLAFLREECPGKLARGAPFVVDENNAKRTTATDTDGFERILVHKEFELERVIAWP